MPAARVWIDDVEVPDIYAAFRGVKLTPEPVIDISGATGSVYVTPPVTTADNGSLFSVAATNVAGSVTSDNATLTVR